MKQLDRRSTLAFGLMAASGVALSKSALAQTSAAPEGRETAPGVRRIDYGQRASMIPGYKTVSLRDVVYQPGASSTSPSMRNDMVCHMLEGELAVDQGPGMQFVARKGDVWTCRTGMPENGKNTGSTVAVMRVIDLLPT